MIYLQLILDASFFSEDEKPYKVLIFEFHKRLDNLRQIIVCHKPQKRPFLRGWRTPNGDASCAVSVTLVLPSTYTHEAICTRASLRKHLGVS